MLFLQCRKTSLIIVYFPGFLVKFVCSGLFPEFLDSDKYVVFNLLLFIEFVLCYCYSICSTTFRARPIGNVILNAQRLRKRVDSIQFTSKKSFSTLTIIAVYFAHLPCLASPTTVVNSSTITVIISMYNFYSPLGISLDF